jgi:hypothetical protein
MCRVKSHYELLVGEARCEALIGILCLIINYYFYLYKYGIYFSTSQSARITIWSCLVLGIFLLVLGNTDIRKYELTKEHGVIYTVDILEHKILKPAYDKKGKVIRKAVVDLIVRHPLEKDKSITIRTLSEVDNFSDSVKIKYYKGTCFIVEGDTNE